jgi:hypothetical protein
MRDEVIKRVITGKVEVIKEYTSMMQNLQIRLNVSNKKNDVPAKILSVDVENMVMSYLYSYVMSRHVCLKYVPKQYDFFDLVTLLDCICLCLMYPETMLDGQTVRDVHNYIYFNFITKLVGSENDITYGNIDHSRDYLVTGYDRIRNVRLRRACQNFFGVPNSNTGFSNAGRNIRVGVPASFQGIMKRSIQMTYPFGCAFSNHEETFDQFDRFYIFVTSVTENLFIREFRADARDFINLLQSIVQRREGIVSLAKSLTRFLEVITVHPLCEEITYDEYQETKDSMLRDVPLLPKVIIEVSTAYPVAFVKTATLPEEKPFPLEIDDIFRVFPIWGYFEEIAEKYSFAKQVLDPATEPDYLIKDLVMFSKQEHLDFAFSELYREFTCPFHSAFKEEVKERMDFGSQLQVDRVTDKMLEIRKKISVYIDKYCNKFGYVKEIAYSPVYSRLSTKQHRRYCVFDILSDLGQQHYYFNEDHIPSPLLLQLPTILKLHRQNRLPDVIDEAILQHRPMVFVLPFPIKYAKYYDNPSAPDHLPITVDENNSVIGIKEHTIYYDEPPEYYYVNYKPLVKRDFPTILPIYDGSIDAVIEVPNETAESYINRSFRVAERMTHNIEVVHDYKRFFSFSFYVY